ncbi:hypothetical protein BJF78_16965 [Pseudonocardia sp. CNS-139]|nr:hypothetical protein BJF78_16965 [Pseudonocardia sp. CNS-139]
MTDSPTAAATAAIHAGDATALARVLAARSALATEHVDGARTLLHVLADSPGHRPGAPAVLAALLDAGADVNARFAGGAHTETALHWAASNDDVALLDALLDAGADIEADGAVIAGGTPLSDAVAFGQWNAARRLVERGARATVAEAAALGLLDRLRDVRPDEVDVAFWYACHGGQQACAAHLLDRGAAIDWLPPWEQRTPLDAAVRSEATELVVWLRERGAHSAAAPGG